MFVHLPKVLSVLGSFEIQKHNLLLSKNILSLFIIVMLPTFLYLVIARDKVPKQSKHVLSLTSHEIEIMMRFLL